MTRILYVPIRLVFILALWIAAFCDPSSAVPTVWTGLTEAFVRPNGANPQVVFDQISPSVALTRGSTAGLYNLVLETSYDRTNFTSPAGTEWAAGCAICNNAGLSISAANWESLTFSPWREAYGNSIRDWIEGEPAVLHLIAEDVYLDIMFTGWQDSFGGGFSYLRADGELPPPDPDTTGDYNGNGIVDAADYTEWRDTLGASVTPGDGADGDESGTIDAGDFTFWKDRFGDVVPGAGAAAAVPEPAVVVLLLSSLCAVAFRRRQLSRAV